MCVRSRIKATDDRFVNKSEYFVPWFHCTGVLVTRPRRSVAADAVWMPTCLQSGALPSEVAWWQKGPQEEENNLFSLGFSQWLATENLLLRSAVTMGGRSQHVPFLIVTVAAATAVWE